MGVSRVTGSTDFPDDGYKLKLKQDISDNHHHDGNVGQYFVYEIRTRGTAPVGMGNLLVKFFRCSPILLHGNHSSGDCVRGLRKVMGIVLCRLGDVVIGTHS